MDETKGERGFEEIIERLEAIANQLERGDIKLEEALALFEEGVKLARSGSERLDEAERKLELLRGNGRVEPLAPESSDG